MDHVRTFVDHVRSFVDHVRTFVDHVRSCGMGCCECRGGLIRSCDITRL